MRNIKNALLSVIGMCLLTGQLSRAVEPTWEYSVQVSATVQTSPAQINLSWPQDTTGTPSSYTVYRKTVDGTSWGTGTTLPGTTTTYTDNNVSVGGAYEYEIVKVMPTYTGYGYIYAGINAPATESRGKLVLLVDNTYSSQLTNELARLQQDLIGDGWTVLRHDVSRNDTPPNIKAVIESEYNADPNNVNAVFLFGHVPVPYSGDIVPDGHIPNHQGAWPADVYYGDMHGVWTDSSVNDSGADYSRNWNVPGDGKFDQSTIPGTVELMVGRVDLANLPGELVWNGPATFPSELDLLRNYLNKDHAFRTGQLNLPRRGLVGDYFGTRNGEAFAASGWRNFAPFFGANNVTSLPNEGTWIPTLASNGYLWAYGCGAGSFSSIGGIGNSDSYYDGYSTEVYSNNVQAIFTFLFGSWLGDWDSQDNIMRTVLALPNYGLTCAWSGRPHWFLHHMALGMPIGYGTRLTQNNGSSGLYQNQINTAAGDIHVALMGDPTLRMHPVVPPTSLAAKTNSSSISLSWGASTDSSIVGYNIYRASSPNGPFTRLNNSYVTGTSYTDSTANSGVYMVRAIKLETSGSGTYYNPSVGAFSTPTAVFVSTNSNPGTGSTNSTGNTGSTGGGNTNTVGTTGTVIPGITNFVDWVDDAVPAGAQTGADGGDSWNWVSSSPTPFSGSVANQSVVAAGEHEHYFDWAPNTLNVNTGDVMVAYVYLDPANPPSEIMLQWCANTSSNVWEHRAYWGANSLTLGANGTAGRYYMGALPPTGQWVPLYVPASAVGLEGNTIRGMDFTLYDGRATWDEAGKGTLTQPLSTLTNTTSPVITSTNGTGTSTNSGPGTGTTSTNTGSTSNVVTTTITTNLANFVDWVDDAVPAGAQTGADGGDSWNWVSSNPTPFSGTVANQSVVASGMHEHYFDWAPNTLNVNTGDTMVAYVYLDPANPPSEIMLQWCANTSANVWEHRAYWGANSVTYGTNGTAGRYYMGALPATGQWVPLYVPASAVGLEGATVRGMSFTLYDGRATWDAAGKGTLIKVASTGTNSGTGPGTTSTNGDPGITTTNGATSTNGDPVITSTNGNGTTNVTVTYTNSSPTVMGSIDDTTGRLPQVGDNGLHILSPNLLELVLINGKQPDPATVTSWNFADTSGNYYPPSPGEFNVTVNGQAVAIQAVGFKRRTLYQAMLSYDLRLENSIYLQLAGSIPTNATVSVQNPDGTLWASSMQFTNTANPLRFSPAIHVNQEGYVPSFPKKAMVGYYLGSMGEMPVPASTSFSIVDATTGAAVYQGTLTPRKDTGWNYSPTPYQNVMMADFSGLTTPGEYQLVVPGLGASLPFLINDGIAMDFARAYALGLYEQRCGTSNSMPFTRFTHDACHTAAASVPVPESSYAFTWKTIAGYSGGNTTQTAPQLTNNASSLYPFVNTGAVDVHGGHHDAGDYSKYTINVAGVTHFLCFAVDSLAGVSNLDNLGIPESGDGIPDVLQECKWEADYLCRLQDADGGFYFIVYPQNREYESNVTPDHGDPQVVWPKNTACSAAATAALAQCASSPAFKAAYPQAAALYLQKAKLGWQFCTNAIAKYGKAGAYQKITFYGDDYNDNDEMAWAACQMFLATGDQNAHQDLLSWFDPSDPATYRWGWWNMSECYGNAIRSYAFAVQSGRVQSASQLNATFLAKCQAEIAKAASNAVAWSQQSAYGTSFPTPTKDVNAAGWYFGDDYGFDIAVAYQLNPQQSYLDAIIANMNYEGGCNPVNVTYVTGLGWKRNRIIVSQMALNDGLTLPPSGVPVGNIQEYFPYIGYPDYGSDSESLVFPTDGATTAPYPFYDRWGDTWNVTTETVGLNMVRAMADLGFLATLTPTKSQPYVAKAGQILLPTNTAANGTITATFQPPAGMDLNGARVVWEAAYQEPAYGPTYTFTPQYNGPQYIHAEAQWPDGRRSFATNTFTPNPSMVVWVEDSLPVGATPTADGGDAWTWVSSNPTPYSGSMAHQSAVAPGEHEHYFSNATGTMTINKGDTLFAYIYIDPANPPTEVMLQWNDGSSWEHRAFWGADSILWGNDSSPSRYNAGALPASGKWVQLAVPASAVGLEGSTVGGMAFTLYNGRATWDHVGKAAQGVAIQ